jgi:hypothetical protein
MSSFGIVWRSARMHAACAALAGAAIAALPAAADTRAFAVATVTATVHAPVTLRTVGAGGGIPAVDAAKPRAYVMRSRVTDDAGQALRYVFIDFE